MSNRSPDQNPTISMEAAAPPAGAVPKVELLAPAGQPDAGYAALHYGADAVYLGLQSFSARAEAVNFTPGELAEFTAHAHSLPRPRRVYLTLNTLIRQDETAKAADTLLAAADCGVDAVIVQDLGMARLVRKHFPTLAMHASTQMAIHNLEGVRTAAALGFRRVTLARELSLGEIAHIAANAPIEIETFIHGTLCYSYSGLCFFSSFATGRSGNRGRCVYSCREAIRGARGPSHPFSLKDLAMGRRAADLARAGAASLKIEGRKKSALYVAATVDYYRRVLDGGMTEAERETAEAGLKTIFARPWTTLFLDGPSNPDAADTAVVGHRGAPLGQIESLARTPAGMGILFHPARPVERHDGIQVDIPGEARPYGFPVDHLFLASGKKLESAFSAPAGGAVLVPLPGDAPGLRPGMRLYHASSQAVKRAFPFSRPKAGTAGPGHPLDVSVVLERGAEDGHCVARITATGGLPDLLRRPGVTALVEKESFSLPCFPAREPAGAEETAHSAFARTGGSLWRLRHWSFDNPQALYCKPGEWNRVRREMLARLDTAAAGLHAARDTAVKASLPVPSPSGPSRDAPVWSLMLSSPRMLSRFTDADLAGIGQVTVELGPDDTPATFRELEGRLSRDRIRLAPPLLMRFGLGPAMARTASSLIGAGWRRWLISNPGALHLLGDRDGLDYAADWLVPVTNALAAEELRQCGFTSWILSPECGGDTLEALLRHMPPKEAGVLVHAHPPLFISAACAHAHLGLCQGRTGGAGGCGRTAPLNADMARSGPVSIHPQGCGSIVTGAMPFSLAGKLAALEAMGASRFWIDLRWHPTSPEEAVAVWRRTRRGDPGESHGGNFDRGLL